MQLIAQNVPNQTSFLVVPQFAAFHFLSGI